MEISRNVILDLLPLYHAGEVSADTRELVESYLRGHPELAQSAAAAPDSALAMDADLPGDHEVKVLKKIKRVMRMRSWLMGMAIFLTLVPFTSAHIGDRIDFFMLRDAPVAAIASFVFATASWIGFWAASRRVASVMR